MQLNFDTSFSIQNGSSPVGVHIPDNRAVFFFIDGGKLYRIWSDVPMGEWNDLSFSERELCLPHPVSGMGSAYVSGPRAYMLFNSYDYWEGMGDLRLAMFPAPEAFFWVTQEGILEPLGLFVDGDGKCDFSPGIKDHSDELPGLSGDIHFKSTRLPRSFSFHLVTPEMEPKKKQDALRRIAAEFNPMDGPKDLTFENDPDKAYPVKLVGSVKAVQHATWIEFDADYKTCSSYAHGTLERIDFDTNAAYAIQNPGNAPAFVRVVVYGTGEGAAFSINGEPFAYSASIPPGSKLVIDSELSIAEVDGVNALEALSGDLTRLVLAPGKNLIEATYNMKFFWKSRWI